MKRWLLVLAVALAACGAPEPGYAPEHERNFILGCTGGKAESQALCACIWGKIEAEVPRREFEALERAPFSERAGQRLTQRISEFAEQCRTS